MSVARDRLLRLMRCARGGASIEFAIVGMAAMLLSVGVVELGRILYLRNELSFAGDIGARAILIDGTIASGVLEQKIRAAFRYSDERLSVAVLDETAEGSNFRTIVVSYPFAPLIPVLSDAITLNVTRRVPAG